MQIHVMEREVVETVAAIMGDHSAAAKALEEAKMYDDPVFFKYGNTLVVTGRKQFDDISKEQK